MNLPRSKGQLLPRQPAGGKKEGERRALVALTVAEPGDEAAQSVRLQLHIHRSPGPQRVFSRGLERKDRPAGRAGVVVQIIVCLVIAAPMQYRVRRRGLRPYQRRPHARRPGATALWLAWSHSTSWKSQHPISLRGRLPAHTLLSGSLKLVSRHPGHGRRRQSLPS